LRDSAKKSGLKFAFSGTWIEENQDYGIEQTISPTFESNDEYADPLARYRDDDSISAAMKFQPQFLSTSTCSDFPLMMHISKGLWKGVIATTFADLPDSDNPLMKKYKTEAFDKFAGKDERWGLFFYAGIAFAEPLVEAIKHCGKDLTREKLVAALEGIKDFQGISGKISYGPFDPKNISCRRGQNQAFLVQCLDGGKAKKLSDWITAD